MKVRYTPEAFSDRERIFEYLRERSASGATNVAAHIREAVKQLEDHPHSGYRTDHPEVRVIFVTRYPYKVFYRVRDEVEILHIRHTSRRAWTGNKWAGRAVLASPCPAKESIPYAVASR